MNIMNKSYSELLSLASFEDRFDYLRLEGDVGRSTFGFDRYLNQKFYTSVQWKDVRNYVIVRDNACDLGIPGYEIGIRPIIHHMNPIDIEDIKSNAEWILDPEYLVTTTHITHNAIHYGVDDISPPVVIERKPNDTALWSRR